MPAAGLVPLVCVDDHQFGELEVVGHAASPFERLIDIIRGAADQYVAPVVLTQLADLALCELQALRCAAHAAVVPQDFAELAMVGIDGALALRSEQLLANADDALFRCPDLR